MEQRVEEIENEISWYDYLAARSDREDRLVFESMNSYDADECIGIYEREKKKDGV